jgi:hypothetical protein
MRVATRDRRRDVRLSTEWNGIDFVEVANDAQTLLRVHFLNLVPLVRVPQPTITGGESIPMVAIGTVSLGDWSVDDGHLVLLLRVAAPGDFSLYTLTITDPAVDRWFERATFSFKAGCPSDLDCETRPIVCPRLVGDIPPIDYLAKDFLSFRQTLLDFSALRYPDWRERSEADFGLMFLEALSGLADDLSYIQDRIAAEATLDTATQRRSIVRHARLVDYEPRPATSARVLLQFDVAEGTTALKEGLAVSAPSPEGVPIVFELGDSLATRGIDPATGQPTVGHRVCAAWNRGRITPYSWDDKNRCLRRGATEMWVLGHGLDFSVGQALLIDTAAVVSADPPIRSIVHLSEPPLEDNDPLNGSAPVTWLRWGGNEKLQSDHDLTHTIVAGNILPATQGRTVVQECFAIPRPEGPPPVIPLATARLGPNLATRQVVWQYLYTLKDAPVAWLNQPSADVQDGGPMPEIMLVEASVDPPVTWQWRRRLLNANSFEFAFTIDAAAWRSMASLPPRSAGEQLRIVADYDGDTGDTIRFGDGTFGEIPQDGAVFAVTYRVGAGAGGNVGADAIRGLDPLATGVLMVTNPLPATGGSDPEPLEQVRRQAPFAFRAPPPLRAVRPEDYRAVAETLPWVQRAGTVVRWTGSWLSTFTTPDPVGSENLAAEQRLELIALLNRRRLAGVECFVPAPHYAVLDLLVQVCAIASAYRGDVKAGVLATLVSGAATNGAAFFGPQNFTFGTPLDRSSLEAAIQGVPGVGGVICIDYRLRGRTPRFADLPDVLQAGNDEIIRLDNDPNRPEGGSLRVIVQGGK